MPEGTGTHMGEWWIYPLLLTVIGVSFRHHTVVRLPCGTAILYPLYCSLSAPNSRCVLPPSAVYLMSSTQSSPRAEPRFILCNKYNVHYDRSVQYHVESLNKKVNTSLLSINIQIKTAIRDFPQFLKCSPDTEIWLSFNP